MSQLLGEQYLTEMEANATSAERQQIGSVKATGTQTWQTSSTKFQSAREDLTHGKMSPCLVSFVIHAKVLETFEESWLKNQNRKSYGVPLNLIPLIKSGIQVKSP